MRHYIKQVKNRLRDLSLTRKYMLILTAGLLLVSLVCFAAIQFLSARSDQMLYQDLSVNLSYSVTQLDTALQQIESLSDLLRSSSSLQYQLEQMQQHPSGAAYLAAYRNVYNQLQGYVFANSYVEGIAIRQKEVTVYTSGFHTLQNILSNEDALLQMAADAQGGNVWYTGTDPEPFVVATRKILKIQNLDLSDLGQLYIQIDIGQLLHDSAVPYYAEQGRQAFLFSSGQLLAGSAQLPPECCERLLASRSPYQVMPVLGKRQFVVTRSVPRTNWRYICLLPYDSVFHALSLARLVTFFVLIGALAGTLLLSHLLLRGINRHFSVLIQKMDYYQAHRFALMPVTYDYSARRDEIGRLHQSFDHMARTVQNLVEENYVKQLLLQESHIKELQQQISPHFLYNTLDTIFWQAKTQGQSEIAEVTESLANLLRASLQNKKMITTLLQECRLVQDYCKILHMRFADRLTVRMEIDHTLDDCAVPHFSLQPLVENAVKYSLDDIGDCLVRIRARREEDRLLLEVQNSGSLFEDGLLEKLYADSSQSHGTGIGLCNLDSRIRILFGEEYGLTLCNLDQMATARITLPCRKLEEPAYENDPCR